MKTAICTFAFIYIFHWGSYGQNKNYLSDSNQQIAVTQFGINRTRETQWQEFADSINSYYKTGIFPVFLNDICLDWRTEYWQGFHSPTAVRWKILLLVKSRKSLELLLKDGSKTLKNKCSLRWNGDKSYPGNLTPPLNKISTYELISRRMRELN